MSSTLEELAKNVASLEPSDQEELLKIVAELNYQKGFEKLSEKFRNRLAQQGKLDQNADEILAELEQVRREIVTNDHTS